MGEYVFCFRFCEFMTKDFIDEKGWPYNKNIGVRAERVLIPISKVVEVCGPNEREPFYGSDMIYDEDHDAFYCAHSWGNGRTTMSTFPGSLVTVSESGIYHCCDGEPAKLGIIEIPYKQDE